MMGAEDIRRVAEKRCRRHTTTGQQPCDSCLRTVKSVLVDLESLGWQFGGHLPPLRAGS